MLNLALYNYQNKVTAEYFQNEYPGLPSDAIVNQRIALARNYSALSGGATGAAYTIAVAATIGNSWWSLNGCDTCCLFDPGRGSGFHQPAPTPPCLDISVLYGHPLDYEDPQDLIDLIHLAFGVKQERYYTKAYKSSPPNLRGLSLRT